MMELYIFNKTFFPSTIRSGKKLDMSVRLGQCCENSIVSNFYIRTIFLKRHNRDLLGNRVYCLDIGNDYISNKICGFYIRANYVLIACISSVDETGILLDLLV